MDPRGPRSSLMSMAVKGRSTSLRGHRTAKRSPSSATANRDCPHGKLIRAAPMSTALGRAFWRGGLRGLSPKGAVPLVQERDPGSAMAGSPAGIKKEAEPVRRPQKVPATCSQETHPNLRGFDSWETQKLLPAYGRSRGRLLPFLSVPNIKGKGFYSLPLAEVFLEYGDIKNLRTF